MTRMMQAAAAGSTAFTAEQRQLIKRTVLKPKNREATDDELAWFLYQAEHAGLDPLSGQIYGIFRFDKKTQQEEMTVQISIDGYRLIAVRSGRYLGQTPVEWADKNGNWHDVWLAQGEPAAARVGVHIAGADAPLIAVARTASYRETYSPLWKTMPDVMIANCAERLALRKAFPVDLAEPDELPAAEPAGELPDRQTTPKVPEKTGQTAPAIEAGRASSIIDDIKERQLTVAQVRDLFDAVEITGPKDQSRDAVENRILNLTDQEATRIEQTLRTGQTDTEPETEKAAA